MDQQTLRPGARFDSPARTLTLEDLEAFIALTGDDHPLHQPTDADRGRVPDGPRAIAHGTLGPALFTGFVRSLPGTDRAVALLDTHWTYDRPLHVGDELTCRITLTRMRAASDGERAVVQRAVELLDRQGRVVQHGTSGLLIRAEGLQLSPHWDFLGGGSLEQLGQALDAHEGFRAVTESYDGALGLQVGEQTGQLRVHRGRVLEATRRTLRGPDFTVRISDADWTELMTRPANDFMEMAMTGRFSTTGSGAEYLRMTRALITVVDVARELFATSAPQREETR